MIQIRKLSHFKKFWLPSSKFWTAKKDTDSDSMHCTALREQESAANRTTGEREQEQPSLAFPGTVAGNKLKFLQECIFTAT